MSEQPEPIAYTALERGTAVVSSDGHEFGSVEHVLAVDEVDVFDGIVVKTADGIRFVDADRVSTIYPTRVETTLTDAEADALPEPDQGAPAYDADADDDTGTSLSDRFGRMFGRGKWKREH